MTAGDSTSDTHRSIELTQIGPGRFKATNDRGGETFLGSGGEDPDFTPVELLLASIAGCTAVTVEEVTSRRSAATSFSVTSSGEKVRDEVGTKLTDLRLRFDITFPDGPEGDAARDVLPRTIRQTLERLCTVSRTVELGTPITVDED
jgi:putative redox protein